VLGLRVLPVPFRLRTQDRVAPTTPDGAFVISEIHVVPEFRGLGIGNALLVRAEQRACRLGSRRCSLHTLTTNPARRLYERHGYSVAAETTDARFEQLTGVTGKILYVKDLNASWTSPEGPAAHLARRSTHTHLSIGRDISVRDRAAVSARDVRPRS
jgi:predicted N-acetyltransferase YhbS